MQIKESITIADIIHEITNTRDTWEVRPPNRVLDNLNIEVSNAYSLALDYLDKLRQRIESLRVPYQPREGLVGAYIRGINTTCNKILNQEPIVSKKLPR